MDLPICFGVTSHAPEKWYICANTMEIILKIMGKCIAWIQQTWYDNCKKGKQNRAHTFRTNLRFSTFILLRFHVLKTDYVDNVQSNDKLIREILEILQKSFATYYKCNTFILNIHLRFLERNGTLAVIMLTQWGRVTHMCACKRGHHWLRSWLTAFRHQTITWTNSGALGP